MPIYKLSDSGKFRKKNYQTFSCLDLNCKIFVLYLYVQYWFIMD